MHGSVYRLYSSFSFIFFSTICNGSIAIQRAFSRLWTFYNCVLSSCTSTRWVHSSNSLHIHICVLSTIDRSGSRIGKFGWMGNHFVHEPHLHGVSVAEKRAHTHTHTQPLKTGTILFLLPLVQSFYYWRTECFNNTKFKLPSSFTCDHTYFDCYFFLARSLFFYLFVCSHWHHFTQYFSSFIVPLVVITPYARIFDTTERHSTNCDRKNQMVCDRHSKNLSLFSTVFNHFFKLSKPNNHMKIRLYWKPVIVQVKCVHIWISLTFGRKLIQLIKHAHHLS